MRNGVRNSRPISATDRGPCPPGWAGQHVPFRLCPQARGHDAKPPPARGRTVAEGDQVGVPLSKSAVRAERRDPHLARVARLSSPLQGEVKRWWPSTSESLP